MGGMGKNNKCYFIKPSVTSPEIKEYLSSEDWKEKTKVISMLYKAVNETLDRTIQTVIGQSKFDEALSEHRYLQSLIHKVCAPTVKFPVLKREYCKKIYRRRIVMKVIWDVDILVLTNFIRI